MLVRQVRVCIRYNLISVLMYYTFEFPCFTAFSFHVSNYKVPLPVAKTFPCHRRVLTRNCNSFLPRIVCNCFETCFKLPVGVMCNFMICQNWCLIFWNKIVPIRKYCHWYRRQQRIEKHMLLLGRFEEIQYRLVCKHRFVKMYNWHHSKFFTEWKKFVYDWVSNGKFYLVINWLSNKQQMYITNFVFIV